VFLLLFVGDSEEIVDVKELQYIFFFGSLLIVLVNILHYGLERLSVVLELVVEVHNKGKKLLGLTNCEEALLLLIITFVEGLYQVNSVLIFLFDFCLDMGFIIVEHNSQQNVQEKVQANRQKKHEKEAVVPVRIVGGKHDVGVI